MNNDLNLCKILKGCEGIELYTSVWGKVILSEIRSNDYDFPIVLKTKYEYNKYLTKKGTLNFNDYEDDECIIFPSKEQRDWSKFEKPIPINVPMMCSDDKDIGSFHVRFYAGINSYLKHTTFASGAKSADNANICSWKYMIPFDRFDPTNIEESLKYNIQK